ncbi:hypothetical protein MMC17_007957 [Xylographa soralifera]|nr:hypothetical protein [Xylographa soralifera]
MIDAQTAAPGTQDGQAGVSLGIFLCMRCAALHRKLGTHISKVKSLSMDSWSNEQVDSMKSRGNTTSNHIYNPKNTQPPVPLDVDEVDSAMERFIRQKYDQQLFSGGNSTRAPAARAPVQHYTGSSDEQPPPPPPKTGKRFGFSLRSASSVLPHSRSSQDSSPISPDFPRKVSRAPSPIRINKQSRIFGASLGLTEEGIEWKLVTLKEMGFPDDKRNSNILKGLNGDLERAIESLVRLGEGSTSASRTRTPTSAKFPDVVRPVTKAMTTQAQMTTTVSTPGAERRAQVSSQTQFQPQALSSSIKNPSAPSNQSYNPFETANASLASTPMSAPFQQSAFENAFQNMQVSQPLFPNSTGGYPNHQQQLEQARMQQSMTPPVPLMPHHFSQNNPYTQQPSPNFNPFLSMAQQPLQQASPNSYMPDQQLFVPQNVYENQISLNSVLSQPAQSQYQQPQPQQQWGQLSQQSYQDSPQQMFNPQYFGQPVQSPMQSPSYPPQTTHQDQFQSIPQPLMPQPTGRYDKSSIMALYNYPQLAPPPLMQDTNGSNAPASALSPQPPAARLPPGVQGLGQRSATMPATLFSGSKNPFLHSDNAMSSAGAAQVNGTSHYANQQYTIQPSAEPGLGQNGRHSPDAFASLSASVEAAGRAQMQSLLSQLSSLSQFSYFPALRMADEEINSSDIRIGPAPRNSFADARKVAIEAIIDNAVGDRVASKKFSKQLHFTKGRKGTQYRNHLWYQRFESFREFTLRARITEAPKGEHIERFLVSILDKVKPTMSEFRRSRGLKAAFDIFFSLSTRIATPVDEFATQGKVTREPSRQKNWIGVFILRRITRAMFINALTNGRKNWGVSLSKITSIVLTSSLSARAGDILSDPIDDQPLPYLCYKDLTFKLVAGNKLEHLVANVVIRNEKGKKNNPSKIRVVILHCLPSVNDNCLCPVKLVLIPARHTGNVAGRRLGEVMQQAATREDSNIQWISRFGPPDMQRLLGKII